MIFNFSEQSALTRYHLMTQTIIPRPIAWVISINAANKDKVAAKEQHSNNRYNLAPFSYFNALSSEPPILALSIGKKLNGKEKDTRTNLLSGRDFVVHIASVAQADALNSSAAALAYGESEITGMDLSLEDFPACAAPRIKQCPVAFHCKLYDVHTLGDSAQAVIYAEIIQLYVNDTIIDENAGRFLIDAKKLDPLARLGGNDYASLGETFTIARPK